MAYKKSLNYHRVVRANTEEWQTPKSPSFIRNYFFIHKIFFLLITWEMEDCQHGDGYKRKQ